jgi:hypothetical protein
VLDAQVADAPRLVKQRRWTVAVLDGTYLIAQQALVDAGEKLPVDLASIRTVLTRIEATRIGDKLMGDRYVDSLDNDDWDALLAAWRAEGYSAG